MRLAPIIIAITFPLAAALHVANAERSAPVREDATSCRAIDGDTLNCGGERIRLNGIDAPEMPGHCRRGRRCVAGDPIASRDHLAEQLRRGPLEIDRIKRDRYGRTVAQVWVDGLDVSCLQLDHAEYRADWDEGGRLAGACE